MEPTNLLLIMSDQHSRAVLGCYGNDFVQTPHLDALAASGTRFANAYCNSPICVPSRASFATGRYPHALRCWDNTNAYVGHEAPSWGHRLIEQGHPVTTIGKLHYRRVGDPSGFPDQRIPMHVVNGVGDLYHPLRAVRPIRHQSRRYIVEAHAGESDYIRYDRGIAVASVQWLREEAAQHRRPWALMVSFVCPHNPLIAPEEFAARYDPDRLPLPPQHAAEDWPRHSALDAYRRIAALDEPVDEATLRRARAIYYGMVSFVDAQVGRILQALDEAGLRDTTRIIYTSDHGETLGAHGLWWKCNMYEEAAGVPLIIAGPDVPANHVVHTNVSLVDCFPTIVEAVGAPMAPEDADLPGVSLWRLAQSPDQPRTVFSQYHAVNSVNGIFMLRTDRYKYIYYIDAPPQLFDLLQDPHEVHDLAGDPAYASVLAACEQALRAIVDPEAVDAQAKADQRRRIEMAGGPEAVITHHTRVPYSPVPPQFKSV